MCALFSFNTTGSSSCNVNDNIHVTIHCSVITLKPLSGNITPFKGTIQIVGYIKQQVHNQFPNCLVFEAGKMSMQDLSNIYKGQIVMKDDYVRASPKFPGI